MMLLNPHLLFSMNVSRYILTNPFTSFVQNVVIPTSKISLTSTHKQYQAA